MKRLLRRYLAGLLFLATILVFSAGQSFAEGTVMEGLLQREDPWAQRHDEAMLAGRDAYNDDDLDRARQFFLEAIQAVPESPAPYRNLARTLHWLEEFDAAVAYYDFYLLLAEGAEDRSTIQQERRAAARNAGSQEYQLPGDQALALRSLRRELQEGRGITAGGGGAFGLYRTLLRMGYGEPELVLLRRELEEKLFEEFEARLKPEGDFLPVMRSNDWALQAERLDAIEELTRQAGRLRWVTQRRLVVEAVDALLSGRYRQAAELANQAARQNRDLTYLRWYEVLALEQSRQPAEALYVAESLLFQEVFKGEARRQVEVFRAQLLQRVGRNEEAAQIYESLLLGRPGQ